MADKDAAIKSRSDHRKLAPLMFLFMALGYTGGVLSLVMQKQPVLESPLFLDWLRRAGIAGAERSDFSDGFWGE